MKCMCTYPAVQPNKNPFSRAPLLVTAKVSKTKQNTKGHKLNCSYVVIFSTSGLNSIFEYLNALNSKIINLV